MTKKRTLVSLLMMITTFVTLLPVARWHARGQGTNAVAVVSAANFSTVVAPDSIAAAFGAGLATRTEAAASVPLPTALAGTTVSLNGTLAPLFFVSPGQINFLVPASIPIGTANLVVTAGNGTVSRGIVQIARVAPGFFTANANGNGVPAAVALRVKADGSQSTEPVADFSQTPILTRPLDLGATSDQLFLILFGTGIRGRANLADVAVRIGGVNAEVSFAGAQGLAGLDQVNVLVPRALQGRGRVNLALNINGFGVANLVELEIAGAAGAAPPQITGYSAATALAGQMLTINGAGFSPNSAEDLVRIGGTEARVLAASATQLTIRVPFGAAAGAVTVRTSQGEGQGTQPLQLRTSVSGIVEDTRRQPLAGVKVRAVGAGVEAITGMEGSFLLPDVSPSAAQTIEFDGGTVPGTLPFPKLSLKLRVVANRDNQFSASVALQQISGPGVQVGNPNLASPLAAKTSAVAQQVPTQTVRVGDAVFEIPAGAAVSFPAGGAVNTLNLTLVEESRTPVNLPPGLFSRTIPQITPFGAVLLPGGKLTLPNSENYPSGTQVQLFRLEQSPNSSMLGEFVAAATATVSADGRRIETAPNAITEITQYFAALPRQTTTVVGRVVDNDGQTPVRQALARCRGQEAFTDGNGGFVLRGVVVNPGDMLSVEASFVRSNGRVDRTQRSGIAAAVGGLTVVTPELVLSADESNRAPVILAPTALRINEGETRNLDFVASDPDSGQTLQLALAGPPFATLIPRGNGVYTLRFQTVANDAGSYTLMLTATDSQNLSTRLNLALTVNRPPLANGQQVTTDQNMPREITLTGSDQEGDPITFIIVSNPSHGSLSGAAPNLTYKPVATYSGTDSFSFKVNDGSADSNLATVSVAIRPVNQAPVLTVPSAQIATVGRNSSFVISAFDSDAGQTLTFSATDLPGGATLTTLSATNAQFSWTPTATQTGTYVVTFKVSDNGTPVQSDSKSVMLSVVGQWAATAGPEGGTVKALFSNGTNLFAGTANGGVFRSTTNGATWTAANTGLTFKDVTSFVMSGPNLFAGTNGRGVYLSDNNGASWQPANLGFSGDGEFVQALALSGTNLFAGTGGGGVFRSTNQGQTWSAVNTGLSGEGLFVYALFANDTNLFAGTGSGVYRSTDQGQSWTAINKGLPLSEGLLRIDALILSGTTLLAGTVNVGIFRSTDLGQNWTVANTGLGHLIIGAFAVSGSNLFAGTGNGVYLSTNQGQSWAAANTGITGTVVYSLATQGANLFAGTLRQGSFVSPDLGQSWRAANLGLAATSVNSLEVNGASLFAGVYGAGVHRSTNSGQNWTAVNTGLTNLEVFSLAVSGANLFVGTNGDGVFLSNNLGQNWTLANTGMGRVEVYSLLADGPNLYAGANRGLFLSTNQGQGWRPINNGLPPDPFIIALAASGANIFASPYYVRGIYRSTDQGANWAPLDFAYTNGRVTSFAVSGANIFAGTNENGVFLSTNQGQSWIPVNAGLTNQSITALTVSGPHLFAGTGGGGVFLSTDQGQSWRPVNTGLTNLSVLSLKASGSSLFAGTDGNGVFITQF